MPMKTVIISYSAGWRYRKFYQPKYLRIKADLESHFPCLKVIGCKVPGVPQILEVQLENGKLLHSMRKGDGEVTSLKLQRIIVELQQEFINDDLPSEN